MLSLSDCSSSSGIQVSTTKRKTGPGVGRCWGSVYSMVVNCGINSHGLIWAFEIIRPNKKLDGIFECPGRNFLRICKLSMKHFCSFFFIFPTSFNDCSKLSFTRNFWFKWPDFKTIWKNKKNLQKCYIKSGFAKIITSLDKYFSSLFRTTLYSSVAPA